MLVLALSTFSQIGNSLVHDGINNISHCYQARVLGYEDYSDRIFDGTNNKTSTLAQIYLSSQSNNECYNVKEMPKEPDRDLFMKAMKKEISTMFKDEIWKLVPKNEMLQHYANERKNEIDIKREKIMMIWSFKRKRHPDGTLNKHKVRLYCHGG